MHLKGVGWLLLVSIMSVVTTSSADSKKRKPGAFVLIIDRSGSMQGAKLEAAKAAALATVDALGPRDEISIITFDSEAMVWVPLQRVTDRRSIAKVLEGLQAGGGTQFLGPLRLTLDVMRSSKLQVKHVIMLSDGESPSDGVAEVVAAMREAKITITTVGVVGADRDLLNSIAEGGRGRLYMVDDLKALPKVFVRELREAAAVPLGSP